MLCSAAVCRINHALLDYHFDRTRAAISPESILFMCCALVSRIKFSSVLPVQGKRDGGGCVATSRSGYLWLSRVAAPWRLPWLRRLPPSRDDNYLAATFLGSDAMRACSRNRPKKKIKNWSGTSQFDRLVKPVATSEFMPYYRLLLLVNLIPFSLPPIIVLLWMLFQLSKFRNADLTKAPIMSHGAW